MTVLAAVFLLSVPAKAQVTPFMQAVAEAAASDPGIAAFYRANGYKPIWTGKGNKDRNRRSALLKALKNADDHALPVASYNTELLKANLRRITSKREPGKAEVEMSRIFLKYARDLQTGILTPSRVDSEIVRAVPLRDRTKLLMAFTKSNPTKFLRGLPPKAPEYARLLKAKVAMEKQLGRGGWGPTVPARSLKPGQSGSTVVALRNRLIAMGYMKRSASQSYDAAMQAAVQQFQLAHGLAADGVAGAGTMTEINRQIEERLPSVLVAIERERWMNLPRGKRHIWVNLTDFTATVVDNEKVTFRTRSVIGKNTADRRSPEFSDIMEYMEINPNWNVPRSISVKEYLPGMIASGGGSAGHLQLIDGRGRVVSRSSVNWAAYSARNFPYDLRQPPSRGNALGLVKFMFPNRHNIYLHDTPAKNLFAREVRAFSHGCIRLNDPFDFAYKLLAKQESDPVNYFQSILKSGRNTRVPLDEHVPVHLVYRTAFTDAKGRVHYRRDVYGRDAKIFNALRKAGVELRALRG
ncbi:L,D-transpeptidase YcbB [Candidatus Rhodobacter oscarellae]|uniref:L,D-transpeptidase YcbB n=1 Tax=Candidatus Rhodobacter oscarellae TaxID=1675527 RepID=A0A0J9E7E7_9RHOB|nr:L,D-transpeptidase family protein [Candidatus Rhodobacter lobularis]KMW57714.1 L,D-transpeptidase YcbB [Candidatus Rhodobacter lobularis]